MTIDEYNEYSEMMMKKCNIKVINNDDDDHNNYDGYDGGKPKSRKKRFYLLFPEGSSLQLSFCAYYYYPGYEFYGLFGLTVALAWQLPTKPPSEQIEHLERIAEHYSSGNSPAEHSTSDAPTSDPKPPPIPDMNDDPQPPPIPHMNDDPQPPPIPDMDEKSDKFAYFNHVDSQNNLIHPDNRLEQQKQQLPYNDWWRKTNQYPTLRRQDYGNNFHKFPSKLNNSTLNGYWQGHNYWYNPYYNRYSSSTWQNKPWQISSSPNNRNRIPSTNIKNDQYSNKLSVDSFKDAKLMSSTPTRTRTTSGGDAINNSDKIKIEKKKKKKKKTKQTKEKIIIPVFGKRKKRDLHKPPPNYDKYDLIDIHYHRTSRHEFYDILEKYLNLLGQNGTECVLKSLCEIGQRENDTEPVEYFREMLRVIFTLPQPVFKVTNEKHKLYDEAHAYNGDCHAKYPLCPTSVWAE